MLSELIDHIRNRSYMSGVERDKVRVKATGEVFTPTPLVQEILDKLPIEQFTDPTKTFLDPSSGDGQFLGEVLIRKMENGSTFEQALSTIYGVDLMEDNVKLCQERLLCGREDLRHIVEKNIVCADGLRYHYRFDGTPCDIVETKEEKAARIKKEREIAKKQKEQEKLAKKKQRERERVRRRNKKEREKQKRQAKLAADKLTKFLQREREKAERLAKREQARILKEKAKLEKISNKKTFTSDLSAFEIEDPTILQPNL